VDGWWRCRENKWGLTPFISFLLLIVALPAWAAYDVNDLKLGASEKEVLTALLAAAGSGAVTNVTTSQAFTTAEASQLLDKASRVASGYRPPGG